MADWRIIGFSGSYLGSPNSQKLIRTNTTIIIITSLAVDIKVQYINDTMEKVGVGSNLGVIYKISKVIVAFFPLSIMSGYLNSIDMQDGLQK